MAGFDRCLCDMLKRGSFVAKSKASGIYRPLKIPRIFISSFLRQNNLQSDLIKLYCLLPPPLPPNMAPPLLVLIPLLLSLAVLVYPFSSCQLSCSSCCCKGYHHHTHLCTSYVKKITTTSYHINHQYGCSIPRDSSLFPLFATDNSGETSDSDLPIEDTDSTSNSDIDDAKSNDIALSPPKYLSSGYKLATITSTLSGLLLLVNIGTISSISMSSSSVLSSTKIQNLVPKYVAGALGYLFLSSGVCNILSNCISNNTNKLYTSNTYRRLNLGILFFGMSGLFTFPAEAVLLLSSTSSTGINNNVMMGGITALLTMQVTKFITTFTSLIGWENSVGGFGTTCNERMKNISKEMYKGLKQVRNDYAVTDERPATFYRTFWIFITINNILFNIPELVFNVQQNGGLLGGGLFSLPVSITLSSIGRLGMLSFILYVLKDAAERKELESKTFIILNMIVGLWAFGVGIAQGLVNSTPTNPFDIKRAADKFLFGVLFFNNGVLSLLSKIGMISKRDEPIDSDNPPLRIGF